MVSKGGVVFWPPPAKLRSSCKNRHKILSMYDEVRFLDYNYVVWSLVRFSTDDFTEGFMQSKAIVSKGGVLFWPPLAKLRSSYKTNITPDSKVHGDNMGPTWALSAPDGPHVDTWTLLSGTFFRCTMKFGSWTYDGFQLDVNNCSARRDLSN